MSKRKLTKIVKKRRKNYKPTIGITLDNGKRVSVNSVVYWDIIRKEEAERAEAELHQKMHTLIREALPELAALEDYLRDMGSWMYF